MAFIENTGLERLWGHIVHRLELKLDESDIATDKDVLIAMTELDMVAPIADANNNIYTSSDGKVFTL
jgi:hypothetical protein